MSHVTLGQTIATSNPREAKTINTIPHHYRAAKVGLVGERARIAAAPATPMKPPKRTR